MQVNELCRTPLLGLELTPDSSLSALPPLGPTRFLVAKARPMSNSNAQNEPVSPVKARRLAYCHSQGWEQQEAAAKAFPRNTPDKGYVSRQIAWAKEQEILRTVIDPNQFPTEELRRIRESIHHAPCLRVERALSAQSNGTLQSVWVFHSGDRTADPGKRLARFGANSAWYIRELLRSTESGVVATAFGATIGAICRAVVRQAIGDPIRLTTGKKVTVIPVMGDPLGKLDEQRSTTSTAIAKLLSQAFADINPPPSLDGVLPVLPRSIPDDQVDLFRDRLYRQLEGYAAVFGAKRTSSDALILKTDVILSSAGFFHSPYWEDFGNDAVSPDALAKKAEIQELADGDIAGVLVRKAALSDAQVERFDSLMRHWMGVRMSDFERVAERAAAAAGGPAGCVLCCIGKKAKIVKHLITVEKIVNHLICDEELLGGLSGDLEV